VLWALVFVTALHRSRYPSFFGRYSREWMILMGTVLGAAAVATLVHRGSRGGRVPASWRYWAGMTILSLTLSVVVLEAALRMFNLLGSAFYTEIRRYGQVMIPDQRLYYRNPVNFRGVFQGVEVSTNALGLRERPIAPKSPHQVRVLVLGDSVAFGWGVQVEDVSSRQLERELRSRSGVEVETINSGVPGYNTLQEALFLQTYGDMVQPDLVLLLYVDNDTDYLDTTHPYLGRMPNPLQSPLRATDYVLSSSRVYFMARHFAPALLSSVWNNGAGDSNTVGWRVSMRSLADIAAYCRTRSIPFVTFLFRLIPAPHTNRLRNSLSEIAQRDHFYFCDTLPWFADRNFRLLVNSFVDAHPNAEGQRILGHGIADFVLSHQPHTFPIHQTR
jgi:hypothetical protein